jgi:alkylation response protein AidB-like acyl-CoA dehydrogenase
MQFDASDEQKLLVDSIANVIERGDKRKAPLARFDEGIYADETLWPPLRDLGVCAALATQAAGGMGGELLTVAMMAEALSYASAGTPAVQQTLAAWFLSETDAGEDVISGVLDGTRLASFALCEAEERWAPVAWRLAAPRTTGQKLHVIGGETAQWLIVGLCDGRFGLIEREAVGVSVQGTATLDRSRPLARIAFQDASIRVLSGSPALASRLHDALLVCTAASACGAARRMLDLAVEYAKNRRQFDRPIGSYQAIKHQLANMALDVEPCRALVWYAAHAWDRLPDEAARAAALAKAHVTHIAVKAGRSAVEVHGGIGFAWDCALHLWLKRAMFDYGFMGSPALHRARAADLAGW